MVANFIVHDMESHATFCTIHQPQTGKTIVFMIFFYQKFKRNVEKKR